jgi:hypothetical protein
VGVGGQWRQDGFCHQTDSAPVRVMRRADNYPSN